MQKLSLFVTEILEDFIDESFRLELLAICNKYLKDKLPSRLIKNDPVVAVTTYNSDLSIYKKMMSEEVIQYLYNELKFKYAKELFKGRNQVIKSSTTFLNKTIDNNDYFDPKLFHVFFSDMQKGKSLARHLHTGNPLSGIIYLDCADDVPPLTMYEPRPWAHILEHYNGLPTKIDIKAENGKLLMWDSFGLMHSVNEMKSNGCRKTLVFGL
tara:strand:+ start:18351 stop:18983 length:633 start_codon:yes stop_codon:yes gene_type:complete